MNAKRKLTQLQRRLKAAQARYRSLEKRAAAIEDKRRILEEKAGRLFDLLMGAKGKRATAKRRQSLATRFKQAKDKAQKLRGLEDAIYRQLKETEEKASNLEDNMRKASRKNPGRKHLPGASAKQQRQYEHIKESELKEGRSTKVAKRIAAATVRARKNTKRKPSPAQLRARRAFARMAKERSRLAKTRRRNASAGQVLKKAGRAAKGAVRATLDAGSKLLKAGAKALNPTKRIKVRNKYIDLVIKGTAKKTPSGWKIGRKTVAQGKGTARISSGYYLDKATGAVYAKRERNKTKKRRRNVQMGFYDASGFHPIRASADYSEGQRPSRSKQAKSVKRKATSSAKTRRTVASRKRTTSRLAGRALKRSSGMLKRRRNASPASTRKKFAGRVGAGRDLFFPQGTPQGLAKLGRLKLIKTRKGTIKPSRKNPAGEVWVCSDTKGRLHLGTTKQAPLFNGPAQNFGEVSRIDYLESKPHLGYGPTEWFHNFGEGGTKRPTLHADGKGGLIFRGGSYQIKREGIAG